MLRVQLQPAYVLHRRRYRNTSQLIDCVTPEHGVVRLVARGSLRKGSVHRALLQLFSPLRISFAGRGELMNLHSAEAAGVGFSISGEASLACFYINELVLKLVPRGDGNAEAFSCYSRALAALASSASVASELRAFEYHLLLSLGLGPNLDCEATTGNAVEPHNSYRYDPEGGLIAAQPSAETFSGDELIGLRAKRFADPTIGAVARRLLGSIIHHNLGSQALNSPLVARDIRGRV